MKIYQFIPTNGAELESVPKPVLAKNVIPDWYKHSEITYKGPDDEDVSGLKTCVPFLDGLISGYMLLTWADIHVRKLDDGRIDIDWGADTNSGLMMERIGMSGHMMPRPAGHMPNHLIWTPKWGVKSPKGWSTLFTHPLNRFDLPFTTMSAIVDSDNFSSSGNIPFFLKEGFEGVIPKGTPYVQLIPIKRERWVGGIYNPSLSDASVKETKAVRRAHRGGYRDKFWVKKKYELMDKE